ncbi:MAG TPA: hypothetical protein VK638_28060 [Edaphobacter sp.]|nr:hypothetical protein [Edaphobacter sp.]
MKLRHQISRTVVAALAFTVMGLSTQAAAANSVVTHKGYQLLGETTLGNTKVTDLFLRADGHGKTYLYVAYAGNTISVLDVTDETTPHEVNHFSLAGASNGLQIDPISSRLALATDAVKTGNDMAVVDLDDGAGPEITKSFHDVDCYTVDGRQAVAFVAHGGELSIVRFNRPVTRDTEIWEQLFKTR